MSKSIERRIAQRNKNARTHSWDAYPEYDAMMAEFGQQHVADDAPIPSNETTHDFVRLLGKGEQQ